ncbi:MAG: hypothetical protein KY475_08560 [Planctomycetes bacterium]|nr:hypothetical protein [Planctomycetota bacterium]
MRLHSHCSQEAWEVPHRLAGILDGGAVPPGFQLSLSRLFAQADRRGPA